MPKFNIYLNFAGNAEEAFSFYKSVFGGKFSSVVRFKDMPMEGVKVPKADETKIMHIALPVGKDDVLMASDTVESLGKKLTRGDNICISVQPEGKEEADRIFKALSAAGTIEMPIADQPWGDYFGSFADKFGIQWMVIYSYPKQRRKAVRPPQVDGGTGHGRSCQRGLGGRGNRLGAWRGNAKGRRAEPSPPGNFRLAPRARLVYCNR